MDVVDAAQRFFLAAGGVDHEIRELPLFRERHLTAKPCQDLLAIQMVALHGALDLQLLIALYQDHVIEGFVISGLDQNRGFHHDDSVRIGLRELLKQLTLAPENVRMYELVEPFQPVRFFKYLRRQPLPVNGAVLVEDLRSKFTYNIRIGFAPGEEDLMAEFIGLDQVTTKRRQRLSNKSFAGSQTACQTYL